MLERPSLARRHFWRAAIFSKCKIFLFSLTQRNNVYWSNPAHQTDKSDYSYLPSKFENVWDPDQAIKNATDQLVRMTASDRIKWSFNGSGNEGFTLKMTFWHGGRMMTMAEATTTAQLYRIIIQFIYFLIRKSFFARF